MPFPIFGISKKERFGPHFRSKCWFRVTRRFPGTVLGATRGPKWSLDAPRPDVHRFWNDFGRMLVKRCIKFWIIYMFFTIAATPKNNKHKCDLLLPNAEFILICLFYIDPLNRAWNSELIYMFLTVAATPGTNKHFHLVLLQICKNKNATWSIKTTDPFQIFSCLTSTHTYHLFSTCFNCTHTRLYEHCPHKIWRGHRLYLFRVRGLKQTNAISSSLTCAPRCGQLPSLPNKTSCRRSARTQIWSAVAAQRLRFRDCCSPMLDPAELSAVAGTRVARLDTYHENKSLLLM